MNTMNPLLLKTMNPSLSLRFSGRLCNLIKKESGSSNLLCKSRISSRSYLTNPAIQDQNASNVETVPSDYVNPLRKSDFFEVNSMVTVKDLFEARVHLGHKNDTVHPKMTPYIFGSRLGHLIFDLEQTADLLRRALNFTAHIAYRGGITLFVSNYHQHCPLIEQTAIDCKEFAHTRDLKRSLFTDSINVFGGTVRLPDLLIFTSTLNTVLKTHTLVVEAAKMNIPTVGIVDTNSDPTIITYPVPGNDDTPCAVQLYCDLFKKAILKGKAVRKQELEVYEEPNPNVS